MDYPSFILRERPKSYIIVVEYCSILLCEFLNKAGDFVRKRIRQMARGKFEYTKPVLSFSEDSIELEVMENSDYSGDFSITASDDVLLRGVVYSTNARMECLTPQFEGREIKVRYQFHGKGLAEGEAQKGDFVIVCNQREYSLSFCASISKRYAKSSVGVIETLYDFTNLAKENWEEAYQLFYHKSFPNIIKKKELKESMIYRGIVSAKPSNQNLEEFLVGIRKKEPIHFSIAKTEYDYANLEATHKETVEISKDQWGFLSIEVSATGDFLQISKSVLTTEDFIGSSCIYEFYIDYDKLHEGKNPGYLTFVGPYQSITIQITASKAKTVDRKEREAHLDIRECRVGIMELYQAYRLKRIVTGVWANETIEILDHLHAMLPEEPMYLLMKAQVLIINRQRQEAEWILDDFKREWIDRKAPVWGYYLYLMTLMEREPSYVDRMTREIEVIFRENPDSVMLFWVLSFLEEEYYNNNAHKLKAIEYWVLKGCSSPYLYLEAYYLIWQDPYLLTKLDKFEIRILRWAIRHKAITKDISIQIFQIVEASKSFDPVMYKLLCAAYEVNPKPANIGIICSYLIKGQQFDKCYHKWYEQGIELELRITGLYEAYLLSMDEREIVTVPKIIQMYFQYESKVPYRKLAVLYNNIIAGKDSNPEMYHKYRRTMGRFAMEQVEQEHMDDNLAVLYRDMLELGLVNEEIAHALSHILYTHKLYVADERMVRAFIYQRQLRDPQIVPISDQTAYFQLYSKEYVILFEDAKGRRYAGSISSRIEPLMDAAMFEEKCMALAPNELSYVVSYFDSRQTYLTFVPGDKRFFRRILFATDLSPEYQAEIVPEIVRFYQTEEYDETLKEYLDETDFSWMPANTRRFMMELLTQNHKYEKAYAMVLDFGVDQVGSASKVALASYMIHTLGGEEDDALSVLIQQAFYAGKYNEEMLTYMCRYYNGPTDRMRDLWKAAKEFEVEAFELEERVLVQMMYAENILPEADSIFESYYENGGRELIVLAYLSYRAHEYFVNGVETEDFVFDMIEARYAYHMELNDACKLALLKHYSKKAQFDDAQYKIEDELLSEYTCRNMNFAFFKKLDHRLVQKYHFYDKMFLEYRTNPRNHVILHYSRDEDGEQFIAEDMPDVYDGIFVKAFVMFFGEIVQYYISEEYGNEVSVTESSRIANNDVYGENDESRYNLLNQMMISNTLQDEAALYHNMKQYAGYQEVTDKLFTLL